MIIRELLDAVRDPEQAGQLKGWAAPLHEKMGRAAARLRVQPWVQTIEESPGKFKVQHREGSK